MDNINKIIKNILIFLVVFLALNYIFQSCQNKEDTAVESTEDLVFVTTDNEYTRRDIVTVKVINNTDSTIIIPNECPSEPFDVYHFESNEWVQKTSNPELKCENATDYELEPGKEYLVPYGNWNHALFSETGRFKIEFKTTINEEERTFTTNEFSVDEEGMIKKLWLGLFYRPIYNGLIFFTAVIPGHDLGLAIILLTLILRTILLIPSQKAMRAQRRMQDVQPRLEKIKQKYKGDQQKIAAETMAIWKEAKVNPFGSCLPMLIQFPILIALFLAIKGGLNPDNIYLLYTNYSGFTLSDINVNFLGFLDLTKTGIYVLALAIGALQFAQMKLSLAKKAAKKDKSKDKKDAEKDKKNEMAIAGNMMTYILPVMVTVFSYSLPAGVGLYWGVSTIYGIIQQLVVNREGLESKNEPKVKVIEPKKSKKSE